MGRRQVLFIQGAGAGTHDEWDDKLVDSLRSELGEGFEVRYPRMPGEDDPSEATWLPAIRGHLAELNDGAVVVGHSVGATLLVHAMAEQAPPVRLAAVALLAAPWFGGDGWPGDGFELSRDLGARLPPAMPVHLFHGLADEEVPPTHIDLYAGAIARAVVHRLPGRDHQLGNDLGEVATVIRGLR